MMTDSGNGRSREVMKGVIKHDSKIGNHTKADGIHMFFKLFEEELAETDCVNNISFSWGRGVNENMPFVNSTLELFFYQSNQTWWVIYCFGSAMCKLICTSGCFFFYQGPLDSCKQDDTRP